MSLDLSIVEPKPKYVKPRLIPKEELDYTLTLDAFSGWSFQTWFDGNRKVEAIETELKFQNFPAAIDFMSRLVDFCEDIQHHPAWANDYKRLRISLTTWSTGAKVSAYDLALAEEINRLFAKLNEV